jgi:D-cysteine desulfhydrase
MELATRPSLTSPERLRLVHGPTPIVKRPALDALVSCDVWIKRDDVTGGAESGNKLRKLEWLMADALARGADTVLTCGGIQSNHARATALVCAQLGLASVLFLRVSDDRAGDPLVAASPAKLERTGNVLLDRLAGAEIRLISRADYAQRSAVMEHAAARLRTMGKRPYVISEGGSNGLGALGYVEAMRETREQIDLGLAGARRPFDVVVHACGSGGTAAGIALGAAKYGTAKEAHAIAVCDDADYFERVIERVAGEARSWDSSLEDRPRIVVDDRSKGPAYGVMDARQKRFLAQVARSSGLVLDPVYTGKALYGLAQAVERGDIARDARVLFVHTGGLPGLLAQGDDMDLG